jgi:hypothetical protein
MPSAVKRRSCGNTGRAFDKIWRGLTEFDHTTGQHPTLKAIVLYSIKYPDMDAGLLPWVLGSPGWGKLPRRYSAMVLSLLWLRFALISLRTERSLLETHSISARQSCSADRPSAKSLLDFSGWDIVAMLTNLP